jgi:hypothetical protein
MSTTTVPTAFRQLQEIGQRHGWTVERTDFSGFIETEEEAEALGYSESSG